MKTRTLFFGILLVGLIFTSCSKEETTVIPSGEITSKSIVTGEFHQLDVSNLFNVNIQFSSGETSVIVETHSNIHSLVDIHKNGERLIIGLDENVQINGEATLNIHIKTPNLDWIVASGAASINFENAFEGDKLELDLSGACKLTGEVNTNEVYAKISGASEIALSGSASYMDLQADGGSNFTGFQFSTNELFASLIGACNASLTVNNEISVQADGGSKLYYKGDAEIVNQNISGGSEVIKMD